MIMFCWKTQFQPPYFVFPHAMIVIRLRRQPWQTSCCPCAKQIILQTVAGSEQNIPQPASINIPDCMDASCVWFGTRAYLCRKRNTSFGLEQHFVCVLSTPFYARVAFKVLYSEIHWKNVVRFISIHPNQARRKDYST